MTSTSTSAPIAADIGYADLETAHDGDIKAVYGCDVILHGSALKLVGGDGLQAGPALTWVKCGCMVTDSGREYEAMDAPGVLAFIRDSGVREVWFHNLGFDFSFLADWIYRHPGAALPGGGTVEVGEVMMGYQGRLYRAELKYSGRKKAVKLKDSAKIWPMKLERLAKSFGLEKGHEALRVNADRELIDYCLDDCRIVRAAMQYYRQCVSEMMDGRDGWLTAASTSYNLGLEHLYREGMSRAAIKAALPDCLESEGFPAWLREGYKGASPLLDPALAGEVVRNVSVLDVNSMYPYQICTKPLPYGRPMRFGEDLWPRVLASGSLWVVKCLIEAAVKPGHRATWLLKRRDGDGKLLTESIDDARDGTWSVMTDVDFRMLMRDYDLKSLVFLEGVGFRSRTGMFEGYMRRWYDVKAWAKEHQDPAKAQFAKMLLNSFYGKFGANPQADDYMYLMGDEGVLRTECVGTRIDAHPKYLPVAMWTTAYARDMISEACNAIGWDNVVYTDTDSVHVHGMPAEEAVRRLEEAGMRCSSWSLGAWDLEERDVPTAIYIRPKGYAHGDAQERITSIKMAGANDFGDNVFLTDLWTHPIYQLRKYRVKGGVLLHKCAVRVDVDDSLSTSWRCWQGQRHYADRDHALAQRILEVWNGTR